MRDSFSIRSCISDELLQRTLKRGLPYSILGVTLLFLGGLFFPREILEKWGLLLFVSGFSFIGYGLIPHKRLSLLSKKPHILQFDGETLSFFKGKTSITIPREEITDVYFTQKKHIAGLCVVTSSKTSFFPHFSRSSCKELIVYITGELE